jgi:pimeloyl-ACP methyl ester carboxylesterase
MKSRSWLGAALLLSVLVLAPVASSAASPRAGPPSPSGPGSSLGPPPTEIPPRPANCVEDTRNGYQYWICMPPFGWNKELIVYAHGYVAANAPIQVPVDQLFINGIYLSDLLTLQGYAFAVSSYRVNGLAIKEGQEDLADLTAYFKSLHPNTTRTYLIGVSEGALITALSAETSPPVYDGTMAVCGPVGDFHLQVNYFGDFRAVFDYFFPNLIPGDATTVPDDLLQGDNWATYYAGTVWPEISKPANQGKVSQLLRVTNAPPYEWPSPATPADTAVVSNTVSSILWYNIFATNDARAKLGGQPYDNGDRWYAGSQDDADLNSKVKRYTADTAATAEIDARYQTLGIPSVPIVTLHTTQDQVVPYDHETLYRGKIIRNDVIERHQNFTIATYGHCNVDLPTTQTALNALLGAVANPPSHVPATRVYLPGVAH